MEELCHANTTHGAQPDRCHGRDRLRWTAVSNVSWVHVTSGASGIGNGTVTYSVAQYTGRPRNRTGTMTIAGKKFTVKQSR